jgi:lipoteichoic acid synthase
VLGPPVQSPCHIVTVAISADPQKIGRHCPAMSWRTPARLRDPTARRVGPRECAGRPKALSQTVAQKTKSAVRGSRSIRPCSSARKPWLTAQPGIFTMARRPSPAGRDQGRNGRGEAAEIEAVGRAAAALSERTCRISRNAAMLPPGANAMTERTRSVIINSTVVTVIICYATKLIAIYFVPSLHAQSHFWIKLAKHALFAAAPEIAVVALLGFVALAFVFLIGRQVADWVIAAALISLYSLIAGINLANIEITRIFGTTLSVGLIYYSDLFGSKNGRTAVLSWIPTQVWIALAASMLIVVLVPALLTRLPRRVVHGGFVSLAPAAVILASYSASLGTSELGNVYTASSTASFLKSVRQLETVVIRPTGPVTSRSTAAVRLRAVPVNRSVAGTGQIKNVIWIVLESTAAQYLDIYQGKYGVNPGLTRLKDEALVIRNGYAHSVASHISMVSMLTSTYPWISLKTITTHAPTIGLSDIATELQRHGFRTAFFHSSDTRHSRADRYLARAGFDRVEDYRGRTCTDGTIVDKTEFYSQATTDGCTFRSLSDWVESSPDRPFFAMLWTFQQHYPYFQTQPGRQFDLPELKGEWAVEHKTRYLSAIAEADALIASLVEKLRSRGLLSSTLIVISGDHGEAFGAHGSFGHGTNLYDEDVKVPIVMINPNLFPERSTERVTGHIDIAPTILDVLGFQSPADWQGASLFREKMNEPIFFFSAWTDYVIGNRIDDRKTIYRSLANKVEVYDLVADPAETNDIADHEKSWADAERQRIIVWVTDQNKKIGDLVMRPQ